MVPTSPPRLHFESDAGTHDRFASRSVALAVS